MGITMFFEWDKAHTYIKFLIGTKTEIRVYYLEPLVFATLKLTLVTIMVSALEVCRKHGKL